MTTLSQEYANCAYKKAEEFGKNHAKGSEERKQYGGMAHKLPVLVRQTGLIQAVTFVYTRGKPGHTALLEDLAQTVTKENADKFLERCRTNELTDYMWLTRKTLAALEWYKRFAESILEIQAGEDGGKEDGR